MLNQNGSYSAITFSQLQGTHRAARVSTITQIGTWQRQSTVATFHASGAAINLRQESLECAREVGVVATEVAIGCRLDVPVAAAQQVEVARHHACGQSRV